MWRWFRHGSDTGCEGGFEVGLQVVQIMDIEMRQKEEMEVVQMVGEVQMVGMDVGGDE